MTQLFLTQLLLTQLSLKTKFLKLAFTSFFIFLTWFFLLLSSWSKVIWFINKHIIEMKRWLACEIHASACGRHSWFFGGPCGAYRCLKMFFYHIIWIVATYSFWWGDNMMNYLRRGYFLFSLFSSQKSHWSFRNSELSY